MRYNYYEAVLHDVTEYIAENLKHYTFDDIEDLATQLEQDLLLDDSVTGNGSGSYTFNAWRAEENICHNWDLLKEAVWEFGWDTVNILDKGAEWCDVVIRCYLLRGAIDEALEELADEIAEKTSKDCGELTGAEQNTMRVCEHCLLAIESHEGNQRSVCIYVDEENETESRCEWCGESGFSALYEF